MSKALTFTQIVIATLIGCLGADVIKGFGAQCVSKDSKGCAETRLVCVLNSLKTPEVIPSCLTERAL